MNNFFKKIIAFVLFALTGFSCLARQYPDSLLHYMETAAKKNPLVMQRFLEYQAALQKIPQAGSLSDPQLDIGVYLSPMELVSGKQAAEIKLMQMFPWFGVLRNAKDEMSQMANAKFEQFRDTKLQVYYDVNRVWNELYRTRKDISISEKNIEILRIIERLALIRYKTAPTGRGSAPSGSNLPSSSQNAVPGSSSGMQGMTGTQGNQPAGSSQSQSDMQSSSMPSTSPGASLTDLYQIQIESGDLRNNIALLKNQEQTITAQFNSYLDRPPLMPVFTGDTIIADTLTINAGLQADSIIANPMLKMINYEKKSYDARKKMVTGMGFPMVGLGLNYALIYKNEMTGDEMTPPSPMNGKDMIMPMVSITIPIYRKKYNAMKKEADLLGAAARQNYISTANSLRNEYFQAIQQYQDAKRRVRLYEEQYQLASKSLDIILKSFSVSASNLTDVLRIRQQTLDYELNKTGAITDLNTSAAFLRRLLSTSQVK
jgi:outer membrane protein TolC